MIRAATSPRRRMFVHMILSHSIEKWVYVATSPVGLIGTDRAVGIMRGPRAPVLHQIEAAHTLPFPTFRVTEVRQALQHFVDSKAGRCRRERHHRWRRIAAAAYIRFALSTLISLWLRSLQLLIPSRHRIDDASTQQAWRARN